MLEGGNKNKMAQDQLFKFSETRKCVYEFWRTISAIYSATMYRYPKLRYV